ncbi:MAG: DUF192 domain-containing protein [Gammaproteobacteria bacterium]|nr:DUF192 domain-containing protein [Gammaproteobacteria bacterium]
MPVWTAWAKAPDRPYVVLGGQGFSVEIASTETARARGLMFRTRLAADHGMLFIYPDAQPRNFWMKNTLIPLDILFFDAQRRLINITADALPCTADPCATYPSSGPAKYVLELHAGTAQKLGIEPGNRLRIRR